MPHPQGSASDFESVHDDGAWLEYIPLSRPFPHELLLKFSSTGVNLGLEDSARLGDVPSLALDFLSLLPRLTSLALDRMVIPGRLLDIIAKLEALKTLSLMKCWFLATDLERILSHATELIVRGVHSIDIAGLTQHGMERFVRAGTLRVLHADHPILGSKIIRECGSFPVLEEVDLRLGEDPRKLSEILRVLLEQTPSLRILRILQGAPPATSSFLDIKPNLPCLSVLACPAWMLSLMGHIHTVSALELEPPLLDPSADLLAFAAASDLFTHLKELRIDLRLLQNAASLPALAPRIVALVIKVLHVRSAPDDVVTLIIAIDAIWIPCVQLIGHRFGHERRNLATQNGIVRHISQIAAQLAKITIGKVFVWIVERTRDSGSAADATPGASWTPRCIDKDVLHQLVHRSGHSLVDFGGYLWRLYTREIATGDVHIAWTRLESIEARSDI